MFPNAGFPLVVVGLAADDDTVVAVQEFGQISTRSVAGANAVTAVTPTSRESSVAAGAAGTVVAAGLQDGRVVVVDQSSMKVTQRFWLGPYTAADPTLDPAIHRRVTALAVTPDGAAVVAADRSGHLRMWRTSDGHLLWSRDDVPAEQLAVSPDGTTMVTVESTRDPGNSLNVSPYCCVDSLWVRIWDLRQHTQLMTYQVEPDPRAGLPMSLPVSYSPDSNLVAVPYENDGVDVFDVAAARLLRHISPDELTVEPHDSDGAGVGGATFSADGSSLLVRLDEHPQVLVLDPRTGARIDTPFVDVHTASGTLALGPGGRWVFSRTYTELTAWDVSTHQRVLGPMALGDTLGDSMTIVSDGHLFAATQNGLFRLDVEPQRWEDAACALAGRALTESEWAELLPGRPFSPACADPVASPSLTPSAAAADTRSPA